MSYRMIKALKIGNGIAVKMVYSRDWEEYQIQIADNGVVDEASTYFTDSREDAEGTFKLMVESAKRVAKEI